MLEGLELTVREGAAIRLLREQKISPLPRGVVSSQSINTLASEGLIERSGIPGFWAITDRGRAVDLDAVVVDRSIRGKPHTWWIDPVPDGKTGALLEAELSRLDRIMPGDELFGRIVRRSALDFLEGKATVSKFVYFSYPIGFPLKHIAWAVRNRCPLWTDHNVSVRRRELGLPATRWQQVKEARTEERAAKAHEAALRAELLSTGAEPWEIDEYFALHETGRAVL